MLSKLSFLPSEDLYPVCGLALDDTEDQGAIQIQTHSPIHDGNFIANCLRDPELKNVLWKDAITKDEMKELSELIMINKCGRKFLSETIDDSIREHILNILIAADNNLLRAEMFWLAHNMRIWKANEPLTADEYSPEWFGVYCSDSDSNYFPVVYLCKERIDTCEELLRNWNKVNLTRNMLCAVVLIYAMASAVMDPANKLLDDKEELLPYRKDNEQHEVPAADVFGNKVLATTITLHCFDPFDQNLYQQVREYFSLLPLAYQVGVAEYEKLRDAKCRWKKISEILCD